MASLIPDFEYDVFISYRQKDNRGEKWVTHFVEALKTEVEATFKEDLSIYFDENPHDGILETHDVDESLKSKLKCLIFLPIVSLTYCDTNCFAWRNEFLAFKRYASEDRFGLKIRLANGNTSSRILPIRIHELEAADKKMLEDEIGPIRSIDFTFKSAGINRPLTEREDQRTTSQLSYRDQINKTAISIKEILTALKHVGTPVEKKTLIANPINLLGDLPKKPIGPTSISVLPFRSGKMPAASHPFASGLAEEIATVLSRTKGVKVITRPSTLSNNSGSDDPEVQLSKGVAQYVLGGEAIELEKNIHIKIQLAGLDGSRWNEEFEYTWENAAKLINEINQKVLGLMSVAQGTKDFYIQPTPTREALQLFFKARFLTQHKDNLNESISHFQKATAIDPDFARAWAGMAMALVMQVFHEPAPDLESLAKSKDAAFRALHLDPAQLEAFIALAFISMCYEWNWADAEQYFNKALAINPQLPAARRKYEILFTQIKMSFEEAESEPVQTIPYFLKSYTLLHWGLFDEALSAAQEAIGKDSNSFMAHRALGLSFIGLEKYEQSIEALEKAALLSNRHRWLLFELMGAYSMAGKKSEALAILDEVLSQANSLPSKIHEFISKDSLRSPDS